MLEKKERYILRKEFFGGLAWDRENTDYYNLSFDDIDSLLDQGAIENNNLDIFNNFSLVNVEDIPDDYLSFPLRIHIALSEKCNTSCKHCFFSSVSDNKSNSHPLNTNKIKSIIDEMSEFGCMELFIGGGEPFMRRDWFDIFSYADMKDIQLFIFTNGLLLTEDHINKLNSLGNIGYLSISMEGSDIDSYSLVRERRTWSRLVESINRLSESARFPVYVRYTATSTNIVLFREFISFITEVGKGRVGVKVRPILPSGNAKRNTSLLVEYKDYLEFLVRIKDEIKTNLDVDISIYRDADPRKRFYRFSRKTIGFSRFIPLYTGFGGSGGYTSLYIDPYGNIQDCVMTYDSTKIYSKDNVNFGSIFNLWHNAQSLKNKRQLKGNNECLECDYYIWCRGGCRARAIHHSNDRNAKDPWCYKDLVSEWGNEKVNEILGILNDG